MISFLVIYFIGFIIVGFFPHIIISWTSKLYSSYDFAPRTQKNSFALMEDLKGRYHFVDFWQEEWGRDFSFIAFISAAICSWIAIIVLIVITIKTIKNYEQGDMR